MTPRIVPAGSREHRVWQLVGYGAIAVLVLALALTQPEYRLLSFAAVAAWAVAVLGMNLIIGFGGQVALGHSAFYGLGGYISAILFSDFGWPWLATLPVAAITGGVFGFLLGLPALRISGLYLALVTLSVALAFPSIAKMDQLDAWTGGANGKLAFIPWSTPQALSGFLPDAGWVFLTLSVIAALLFWLMSNALRSRAGRALVALRDNQTGAAVSGVQPAVWKTSAFAISAAYATTAGAMMTLAVPIIGPESGGFLVAIALITAMILGGASTISGAVIGALALVWLPDVSKALASNLPMLSEGDGAVLSSALYGVILIVVVVVMPGGVATGVRNLRSRFVGFVPALPAPAANGVPVADGAPAAEAISTGPAKGSANT